MDEFITQDILDFMQRAVVDEPLKTPYVFDPRSIPDLSDLDQGGTRTADREALSQRVKDYGLARGIEAIGLPMKLSHTSGGQEIYHCPFPHHEDKRAGFSVNEIKGVYYCHSDKHSEPSGDIFSIAGEIWGMDTRTQFPDLLDLLAEILLGVWVAEDGTAFEADDLDAYEEHKERLQQGELEQELEREATRDQLIAERELAEAAATIVVPGMEIFDPNDVDSILSLFPPDSFIHGYVEAYGEDVPPAFQLWAAMAAIAVCLGRDSQTNIQGHRANLWLVLVGTTRTGKSRTQQILRAVVEKALPWVEEDVLSPTDAPKGHPGVVVTQSALNSGEAVATIMGGDPEPKKLERDLPDGRPTLLLVDEMSRSKTTAARSGNSMSADLTTAYNNGMVATASKVGFKGVKTSYLISVGGMQPNAAKQAMEQSSLDSGFFGRYTYVEAPPILGKELLTDTVEVDHTRQVNRLAAIGRFVGTGVEFRHTEEARVLHNEIKLQQEAMIFEENEDGQLEGNPAIATIVEKLFKLEMIIAANLHVRSITPEIVEVANLLLTSSMATSEKLADDLHTTANDEAINRLLSIVAKNQNKDNATRAAKGWVKQMFTKSKKFGPDLYTLTLNKCKTADLIEYVEGTQRLVIAGTTERGDNSVEPH